MDSNGRYSIIESKLRAIDGIEYNIAVIVDKWGIIEYIAIIFGIEVGGEHGHNSKTIRDRTPKDNHIMIINLIIEYL